MSRAGPVLLGVGCIAFGLFIASCSPGDQSGSSGAPTRPNIVLFVADDLAWSDNSIHGNGFYETPNLERLAESGVTFASAYAPSPMCSSTRASLLTGQYPGRLRFTHAVGHLAEEILEPSMPLSSAPRRRAVGAPSRTRLPLEYLTLAERLADSGYRTSLFGKWHLGSWPYTPGNQGFGYVVASQFFPFPAPGYFAPWLLDGIPEADPGTHISDHLAAEAATFIRETGEEPFFLCFWDFSVHNPFEAKPDLIEKYTEKARLGGFTEVPLLAAMVESMDDAVGTLLDALEDRGILEDTVFVFTSDNGGDSYATIDGIPASDNGPLRSGKSSLYEGGVRVPLVVAWPGRIEARATREDLASGMDLYPTFLELADVEAHPDQMIDGTSLVGSLLRGRPLERDTLFWHFPHYLDAEPTVPSSSVRQGKWKLIRFYADSEDQSDRVELYDLEQDIGESRDLAGAMNDKVRSLQLLIDVHLSETQALVPFPNPDYSGEGD